MTGPDIDAVEAVFRRSSGVVTASLIKYCGDFDLAEDAVQEAFVVAIETWPRDGLPPNPGGWIATTAKRRLIDALRRDQRRADKHRLLVRLAEMPEDPAAAEDNRLRLLFTCCHPTLSLDVRVALTLRTVCGLSSAQIGSAFLVPEATMAQRLVRGRRKIKIAKIPYEVPAAEELGGRLSSVLSVIYLVFNTGYQAVVDPSIETRHLVAEAIGLNRSLDALMPGEPEIMGLLALMLLHDARSSSRVDAMGDVVLLDRQDRSRWNSQQIERAFELIAAAPRLGGVGQYWLQAAIAAEHLGPADPAEKNWRRIVSLYDRLLDQTNGSEVVQLNRAIALAEAHGPAAGLAALEPIAERLVDYSYFFAARAEFRKRAGDRQAAADDYRRALDLSPTEAQRRSLASVLREIEQDR